MSNPGQEMQCLVQMSGGEKCGRPIYNAPAGVDEEPVCLMRSRDPNKDKPAFWEEFDRTIQNAGEGTADFGRVAFPATYFGRQVFVPRCIFREAIFMASAHFSRATFAHGVEFDWATFAHGAYFAEAMFAQEADFVGSKFTEDAYFGGATFHAGGNFNAATFVQEALFYRATFTGVASFLAVTFMGQANFDGATFAAGSDFGEARFTQGAEFRETIFPKQKDDKDTPGAVFTLTRFEKPEEVIFYQTDLSRALFHNCDVSKFVFSNVTWRKRPGNDKNMVLDEVVDFNKATAFALRPPEASPDDRKYSLVAEVYQQLKKNYDDRRDYWTAGDFHYGEMELKRQSSRRRNPLLRWWHRNLGLVAWYKYASEYGESYVRPVVWLGIFLALFMLAFPIAGLRPGRTPPSAPSSLSQRDPQTAEAPEVSYSTFFQFLRGHPGGRGYGVAEFFGHSLMTTVQVAAFQREFAYEPSYPWGRALALIELAMTSTLIALFLLAVRRHCRR